MHLNPVQDLIDALNTFEFSELRTPEDGVVKSEDGSYFETDLDPRVRNIIAIANRVLITQQGQPNYVHIQWLKHAGWDVHAGDRDSFSWLTGVLESKKGPIMFG